MSNPAVSAGPPTQPRPPRQKLKLLYVCHNHPAVMPGGAETYALELYEAMRRSDEFEPMFLARRGPSAGAGVRMGTPLSRVNEDAGQYFFYTDPAGFDFFYGTARDKSVYTKALREFLLTYRPDVVHLQHTIFFGFDLLRLIKTTLPHTPIVYTLHEYLPICNRSGQMLRTVNNENCMEASPRRCNECFPDIPPQDFFLRKRYIQSQFSLVDLFLAPSRFLVERYVDWGIPREKITFEENGRPVHPRPAVDVAKGPANRFAFFGQITEFKGVDVLLKAMRILGEEEPPAAVHLWLHGANLQHRAREFQDEIKGLLEDTKRSVTMAGRYQPADLPALMANANWVVVPSIWWENAPLVIQEAFQNGRPVICSGIGGMAEKVTDGVNGLHFRAGDPHSLAQVMRRAATTEGLWESLCRGIPEVHRMEDHVRTLTDIYLSLAERARAGAEG
ncbi:MAG: glycosyltransferase family 4 protein [Acidobacteriota bacterium]|nr:glycosyltransferase family 4 protein [Acidobacteriota bacterium]